MLPSRSTDIFYKIFYKKGDSRIRHLPKNKMPNGKRRRALVIQASRKRPRWRQTAARVAGGTLGYIAGNIPGAVAGATIGGALASSRSSGTRRRKRSTNIRSSGLHRDGSDNFQTAYKKRGKVSSKKKGKTLMKLNPRFRKAVKQVIRNFGPKGFFTERFYSRLTPGNMKNLNYDVGGGWLTGQEGTTDTPQGRVLMFFDPTRVNEAASVLFNGATVQGSKQYDANLHFDIEQAQIDVLKQWVKMEMKNNTSRTMYVKIWTWQFKNNYEVLRTGSFVGEWADCALDEANNVGKINVSGATTEEFGMSPKLSPSMRKRFAMEEKLIILEPGKSYVHTIQGPSQLYDFSKFKENTTYTPYHKFVKGCMIQLSTDLTGSTTAYAPGILGEDYVPPRNLIVGDVVRGATHRWSKMGSSLTAQPYGLLIETTYNYSIRMPDQTGYKVATAGTNNQQLNARINHPYHVKVWNTADLSAGIFDKNDEEPSGSAVFGV